MISRLSARAGLDVHGIRGDLFGGLTAAVVALPLALAFGVTSGAGALAGLYGAIIVGFFAAVCGGTRVQVSGPTGPMTVVMALIVTQFGGNLAAAFAVVIVAGLMQVGFGLLGIGRFIKLVPQPVVSGFMSGIGFIIIIVQLAPMLGLSDPDGEILVKLAHLPEMLRQANFEALLLGLGILALIALVPARLNQWLPAPLIALVTGTLAAAWFALDVPVIGPLPEGIPVPVMPRFDLAEIPAILRFALILAFIGAIDSLLTSLVADSITRSQHNSNRELVGQGIGNTLAGLFGGIPGAGATMRTLVNLRAGGKSRFSGAIHAVFLFAIALGAGGVVSHIPMAVLAAILLKVGFDIIDWRGLRRLHRAPRGDVAVMLSTLLLTIFVDLMTAVATGFVLASVLFVARVARTQTQNARFLFGADEVEDLAPEEQSILNECNGRVVLFHVEGPLSFGSARDIGRIVQADIDKDVLVIDLRDVPFIDSSAAAVLDDIVRGLSEIGDGVMLFGARPEIIATLKQTGVTERLGEANIFDRRIDALTAARGLIGKWSDES